MEMNRKGHVDESARQAKYRILVLLHRYVLWVAVDAHSSHMQRTVNLAKSA